MGPWLSLVLKVQEIRCHVSHRRDVLIGKSQQVTEDGGEYTE
jgi:hypothetical protein